MSRWVITFTLPNEEGREIVLCRTHDETHPHLGAVSYGMHRGMCEDCARDELERAEAEERSKLRAGAR